MNPELAGKRRQATFQGAEYAGCNSGGMPIHAHDGAEGLEPEWMRQAAKEFVATIVVDDRLGDDGP
jgi:hypothetical protein